MIEEILVQYNNYDAALFGPDNAGPGDHINMAASRIKFAEMLGREIGAEYPAAIVKVAGGPGPCEAWRTDGLKDIDALAIVREILRETWASFNWLVDADVS